MANIGIINKYIINSGISGGGGGGGGYLVLGNHQTLLSNIFPLALPPIIFFIKYRRNKLLHASFIE